MHKKPNQWETMAGITPEIGVKSTLLSVSAAGVCSTVEPEVPVLLSLWFWFSPVFLAKWVA